MASPITVADVRPLRPTDHILGSPTAKVLIVEYSDFECSFCKDFHSTMHQVITTHGADASVAWVYRNFPIVELHANARKAAEAAECVALTAGNDAYWKFVDILFAHQPTDPAKYAEYAHASGANPEAVGTCEQNAAQTVDPVIDADTANAKLVGAVGTPYSLILAPGKAPIVIDGAFALDTL